MVKTFVLTLITVVLSLEEVEEGYDWCPQYHLIRDKNVYDPSGPIYNNNNGIWHVFEDHCEWCHWYSTDLLHWKQLAATGFTGLTGSITTINNNEFIAFYPSGDQLSIMRAVSSDNMLSNWTITGSVIKNAGYSKNYRDPLRPLIINGSTYIGVGSGDDTPFIAMILWYKSMKNDLTEWSLLGSLFNITETYGCIDSDTVVYYPNASYPINAVECPDVFLMDDKYVVIAGLFCTNEYWVGNINNNQFKPLSNDNHALLDYGNFYAAKTGTIANGVNGEDRRILFGFTGWNEPTAPSSCGRSHVIPRDITLNNNNLLNFSPIKEIMDIRGDNNNVMTGSELEIILNCDLISPLNNDVNDGNISINVLISSDLTEYVQIGYSFGVDQFNQNGYFYVDHRKCCNDNNNIIQTVSFNKNNILNENGIYLNILLDRSIIESFLNKQKVITSMINPSNNTSPQMRTISVNNNLKQNFNCFLQSWQLQL